MKLTYHNDKKFKRDFVKETRWHREQDLLVKGSYRLDKNGKITFCSVGCSVNSLKRLGRNSIDYGDHAGLSELLGWPEWLCRLQDQLFEGLPKAEAMMWTERLAAAVPVGKDIEPVKWHFCAFLMRENIERVLSLKIKDKLKDQVISAIRQVLAVHTGAIDAGRWDESAARSAESAARSAESAAWSAARSAAWSARSAAWSARSAAWSARSAAWSAESAARSAESAAWSAESAARSAANTRYSEELLRILKSYK